MPIVGGMPENMNPGLSRRRLLLVGLGTASAAALPMGPCLGAVRLPLVKPIWSQTAYSAFGVQAVPQNTASVYQYIDEWMSALAATQASYFRASYVHGRSGPTVAAAARSRQLQWGMSVCPDMDYPDADLAARLADISARAADVCLFIQGINEPNYIRGGGTVPSDWPSRTVAKQKLIWQTVRADPKLAHVKVVGPKLQAVVGTESQYRALGAAGIAKYMDYAAVPSFSNGRHPYPALRQRLAWVRKYWGGKRAWISETGYSNALAASSGRSVVPEDVSAAYAPAALLEALDHRCKGVSWFELLDSPDPGSRDVVEANFGMFAMRSGDMAPPWRPKPVVTRMSEFLSLLKDDGAEYDPPWIRLKVTSGAADVRHTVTGKRDGSAMVHIRRARDCWDPQKKRRLNVPEAEVKIRTATGTRTVYVDHQVGSFRLSL